MVSESQVHRHFQQYWRMLGKLLPQVRSLLVFSGDGHFIWFSGDELPQMMDRIGVEIDKLRQQVAEGGKPRLSVHVEPDRMLDLLALGSDEYGSLMLVFGYDVDTPCLLDYERELLDLANEGLLREHALVQQLIEKEQELNQIADELGNRYEELNLIYTAHDPGLNPIHGRELLHKIVSNAASFLDVDIAVILVPGKEFRIVHQNHGVTDLQGRKLMQLLDRELFRQLQAVHDSLVINNRNDAIKLGLITDFPHKLVASPLVDLDQEVVGLIAIINRPRHPDFTNSDRSLLEVLANKASSVLHYNFDPLTGLENSHSFELIVGETLKQTWKTGRQHAIVNIDIDRMAVINDMGGLEAGDRLLRTLARVLRNSLRAEDSIARLGSDKFGILIRNSSLDQARKRVEKIARAASEIEVVLQDEVHEISISAGIAPVTSDIPNVSSVLGNAETARQAAKEKGRGQIQVFELDDKDLLRRKEQIHWVSRIQAALREDRFELFAQRIQPIRPDDDSRHYEILVRMRDEKGERVAPGLFLPAAENFFLMPRLDRWVIEKALSLLAEHDRCGPDACGISINLSGQSMTDPELAQHVRERIRHYGIDPRRLCFEVTETAAIANIETAQVFIRRIRELGCLFSLDDFGTGQSSFAYLKNLEVDFLKIDGAFVHNLPGDRIALSMVTAIHHVARAMDLRTIAEYVENQDILDCLGDIGVDYAQGYGVHKPEPFTELLQSPCCSQ